MAQRGRAALYARLSEEDREKKSPEMDSESILNQVMLLKQYADHHGWEVYECYTDDNWAGADRKRPAFNRLLLDAEQGKFDIVLCKTQSRFTREMELVEKYIHGLFPLWGIRFIGVVDHADTNVRGNKKARQINGLMNEWYLEDLSDNIRSVLTSRRQKGYYIGSIPLYGYQKDPAKKGHLIPDPEASEVVRLVFDCFAKGMGKTAIARMLNERGIPNPTEYKRQKGIISMVPRGKSGKLWKYSTISDMLNNEMYIGNLVQGKYGSVSYKTKQNKPIPREQWIRVEDTHEAIIDRELWELVRKMLDQKPKASSDGMVGIFAGKVRCRCCGYVMRSGKGRGKRYFRCSTKYAAKGGCEGAFIYEEKLEKMVIDGLREANRQYLDEKKLEQQLVFTDRVKEQMATWEMCVQREERKRLQLDEALKNLYLDKTKGEVNEEVYPILMEQLVADRKKSKEFCDFASQQLEMVRERGERTAKDMVSESICVESLNRAMVEHMVDHIEVSSRDPESKKRNVWVYWNF